MPVQKSDTPVWEQPDPTKTENPLSKKKKASAKARAKAAGRPYPNLIDNMAAAKNVKKDDQASLNISGKLHRIYREKNGDVVVNHAGTRKQNGSYDKINLTNVAGVKSVKGGVKSTTNWHKNNPHTDVKKYDSPAWTRSEGKNPSGGLNAKGRASAKAEGHNLKPPVKSGDNPRRASFLARMGNMPGPEHKPNGEPTRLLLSLNAWGASSKADAKKKAAAISGKVDKGIKRIPGQLEIPGMGDVVQQAAKRRLPTEGRWKHLSGKTSRVRIVGPSASAKDSFDVIDSKDVKRILSRDQIAFIKPKNVSKSMEYSVPMNQSRFGGASAVGKAYDEKPKPVWEKPNPSEDSDPLGKKKKASAKARARAAGRPYPNLIDNMAAARSVNKADKAHYADRLLKEVGNLAAQINTKAPEHAYKKGVRTGMRHNAKVLVPLGAVGGSAATATGMTVYGRRKREPMPVVVVKAEQMYDQMGNPVPAKSKIMSGDAKLGAAGAAVGVVGANRMAFARTLPDKLKGQADAAAQKVAFQERLATDQIARVQAASQIPNRFTRRKQVNMHQFYSDKAQGSLSTARSKQAMANNALAAAPNKKRAHLKSGGALVATGATMGGLAAYNNSKKRKEMGKVK